jgi:hypothetical protein
MAQQGSNKKAMERFKKPSMELLHQALEIHSLLGTILPKLFSESLLPLNSSDSKIFDKAILDTFESIIQISSSLLGSCLTKFSHNSSELEVRSHLTFPFLTQAVEDEATLVKTFSKYCTHF